MPTAYTWADLACANLPRQLPRVAGRGSAGVVDLVRAVGPVQSQVARAPFVTGPARRLQVRMFPGERVLDGSELAEQVRALETVLDITVTEVEVVRAAE